MLAAGAEHSRLPPLQQQTSQRRAGDRDGKRSVKEVQPDERRGGEQVQHPMLEGAFADPKHCLEHDGHDDRLHSVQQAPNDGYIRVRDGQPAQQQQHEYRRQDEQRAGHDAARYAVHAPGDVDSELRRLRPWQQHREVQGTQEHSLWDPALLLDELAVHDRNLTGWATEIDEAELQPELKGFAEAHLWSWWCSGWRGVGDDHQTSSYTAVREVPGKKTYRRW